MIGMEPWVIRSSLSPSLDEMDKLGRMVNNRNTVNFEPLLKLIFEKVSKTIELNNLEIEKQLNSPKSS